MKDAMGAQVLGGTKWKRFALVMVPTVGIAGAMTVMMASGAIPASFAVSGQNFEVSADTLDGQTFAQSGDVIVDSGGKPHAVAVAGIKSATITNMCQSVKVPTPLGDLVIVLKAGGGGTPATATDLVLDTNQVNADAVFTNVNIGADAADVAKKVNIQGFQGQRGAFKSGTFAQVVDHAVLTGVRQTAYSTTAGTMTLKGLSISASLGGKTCF
jgi:hypothetical protein